MWPNALRLDELTNYQFINNLPRKLDSWRKPLGALVGSTAVAAIGLVYTVVEGLFGPIPRV